MVDIKDFDIQAEMDKRKADSPEGTRSLPTVFIPRYINYENGRPAETLQDLGWRLDMGRGYTHLVHYCGRCRCQRTFTILSEHRKISKKGREYVDGYHGFCDYCKENDK